MNIRQALARVPREVKVVAAVLVVGLSFFYLGSTLVRGIRQLDLEQVRLQPVPLLLALLLFMAGNGIGGLCWSLILEGLGQTLSLRQNIKTHLSATIAKYLPGYAWQILGKAYLCQRQGVSGDAIAVGIALEFLCIVLTGLWAMAVTLPSAWLAAWGAVWLIPWRTGAAAVLTILLLGLPWLLSVGLGRIAPGRARNVAVRPKPLWRMLGWMIAAWCALGLAVYICARSFYPLGVADWPPMMFSWASSSILSLAIIFVPTGIGIREGALAFLLGFRLPAAIAAIVAVLTRVLSVVGEALCFVLAQWL